MINERGLGFEVELRTFVDKDASDGMHKYVACHAVRLVVGCEVCRGVYSSEKV